MTMNNQPNRGISIALLKVNWPWSAVVWSAPFCKTSVAQSPNCSRLILALWRISTGNELWKSTWCIGAVAACLPMSVRISSRSWSCSVEEAWWASSTHITGIFFPSAVPASESAHTNALRYTLGWLLTTPSPCTEYRVCSESVGLTWCALRPQNQIRPCSSIQPKSPVRCQKLSPSPILCSRSLASLAW